MLFTSKYCSIILFIYLVPMKACVCDEAIEVNLKQGVLSGKVEKTFLTNKDYYSFKGVPYANPPIDKLRFKPPEPHQGWDGVYEAYDNKPTCVQYNTRMRYGERHGISGSEDCLYVSIFSPSLEGSTAVLVFDFHDNYRTGYNGTNTYSPEFLTEEDVIVVTFNHRLGLFGYLTTEDEVIPANNGLRDYILALKWIKENIKSFGGDPENVTLMGSKGGASLSNILLYSEQAKGLFKGATMQGGTALEAIYFPENPKENAFKLAELLEIKSEDSESLLNELQSLDFEKIYAKEGNVLDVDYHEKYQKTIFPFSPVIEKDGPQAILTTKPENGKIVNDVPILIGFNSREGLDLVSYLLFNPRLLTELNQEFFVHFPIRTDFRFDINNTAYKDFKEEIFEFYFKDGYLNYNNILEYAVYVGDTLQNYAINLAARKLAADLKSAAFYYMFDFNGYFNENMIYLAKNTLGGINNWGASLGDELCYLHLCSQIRRNYEYTNNLITEQNEFKVIKKMIRMWANFAKFGNPTPEDNDGVLKSQKWQPLDKDSENLKYLHITKNLRMRLNPLGKREKFWDKTLEKYAKSAVDGVAQRVEKPREEL